MWKRILLLTVCLCLGLTGCKGSSGSSVPETRGGETVTLPTLSTDAPETTASESGEPSDALSELLPTFAAKEYYDHGAVYEDVPDEDVAAYAAQMEEAGYAVWKTQYQVLVHTDRMLLLLSKQEWAENTWNLHWQEAAPDTPVPDLDAVQAMFPEGKLLALLDVGPADLQEAAGIRRLYAAIETERDSDPIPQFGTPVLPASEDPVCITGEVLAGPSGCTALQGYMGGSAFDPLWADLDGDGENEFVYWTYGPTSGVCTVALWAYGLEEGFPVVKGQTMLNLSWGDIGLEKREDGAYLRYVERKYNRETGEQDAQPEVLIPLTMRDGRIGFRDGDWPEEIRDWGGDVFGLVGSSFETTRANLKDDLLLDRPHYLIWRANYDRSDSDVPPETYVAFTTNGISVTGLVSFREDEEGKFSGWRNGAKLIPVPEDPESLVGCSEQQLVERLGPCHFREAFGGNTILYYLTEDARILSIHIADDAISATLSLPLTELLATEDTVFVSSHIPSTIQNRDRWDEFLARTSQREPDQILLQLAYPEGIYELKLRYDGKLYYLEDEGREESFPYLLVSEETDPPAQARFSSATHYLLSNDPKMTHSRYFSHMVSSVWDPDFPTTRGLLTLYRN